MQKNSLLLGHPGEIDHPEVEAWVDKVRQAALARGRTYLGDAIVGERATNLFLNGARAFLEANAEALNANAYTWGRTSRIQTDQAVASTRRRGSTRRKRDAH